MSILGVSRRVARGLVAQVDRLERVRQKIVAAAARLLQPKAVLVPIRITVARKNERARD
jgi:hypothetical protein